jgi:DNA-binding response OmpR family regulator
VKLLIVDESSAMSGRLLMMLGGVVHLTALSIARSLQEADEKSRNFCPDVVVLDTNFPDGSGLDALYVIQSTCPHAYLLMFSNQIEYRNEARQAGADAFFDKSLEFEELVVRLVNLDAMLLLQREKAA